MTNRSTLDWQKCYTWYSSAELKPSRLIPGQHQPILGQYWAEYPFQPYRGLRHPLYISRKFGREIYPVGLSKNILAFYNHSHWKNKNKKLTQLNRDLNSTMLSP